MKYYPISKLQANTPEVGEILNLLQPLSTSSAEFDDMKISLILFMKSLRNDLGVEVEERYVDKVYRDSYYSYYDTKRLPYSRYCVRLSFFDSAFNKDVDLDDAENIKNNYLGFVVLRPLRYCIGRNVIDPKAKADTSLQHAKICRAAIESSCFGIKLNAVGFPHSSQDTETMTCAQTTIWALLEYYGNKYNIYRPTTPSEIKRILESFSYERQLPSSGLTYNQISVALRSLGFGSKVYTKGTNVERFNRLLACYVESGIPIVLALQGSGIGHAVVCIGREGIDKSEVRNHQTTSPSGKIYYDWNDAVASKRIVLNDDNLPNYQLGSLSQPCNYYSQLLGPNSNWEHVEITQFIAPLYNKIYMDAEAAMELSTIVLDTYIQLKDQVKRTFLTSGRTLREHIAKLHSISNNARIALLQIDLPKFVWVTELSTIDEFENDQVNSLLLIDATGNSMVNVLGNIIFLISNRYFYTYDSLNHQMIGNQVEAIPQNFEAFPGNLK